MRTMQRAPEVASNARQRSVTAVRPRARLYAAPSGDLAALQRLINGTGRAAVQAERLDPGYRELVGNQAAIHPAAKLGTSGSGGRLPHLDLIQRSFGRHDVAGIVAHTDAAASAGARAMSAEAFTTGNHVAFAGSPSLHTAAHE